MTKDNYWIGVQENIGMFAQEPDPPSAQVINKPVGVVPIGSYEVLTLATTQESVKNKKPPNLPRLNSFKKSSSPRTSRMNSRDDSTASQHQNHSPSSYQNHVTQGSESRTYDAVPPPKLASVHGPSNQGLTDSFDSRTTYDALPPPTSASLHRTSDQGSVETVSSGMTYDALPPPNAASLRRTSNQGSTDTVNSGMTYDALPPPKPTAVHVLPKPPPGLASQIAKQAAEQKHGRDSTSTVPSGFKVKPYADIVVSRKHEQVANDTRVTSASGIPSYTQVYVSDKAIPHPLPRSDNTTSSTLPTSYREPVPGSSDEKNNVDYNTSQAHQSSGYEDMTLQNSSGNQSKYATRTPEAKRKMKTIMRTGYEDMTGKSSDDEDFPLPPPTLPMKKSPVPPPTLPLKQSHVFNQDSSLLSPKKISSGAQRRQESYENVMPKQLVPVRTQNPFNMDYATNNSHTGEKDDRAPTPPPPTYYDAPLKPREKSIKPSYENFKPPDPVGTTGMRSYENFKPPGSVEEDNSVQVVERKVFKSTTDRPVPLPPKMSKRNSQEPPLSPMSPVSNMSMYFPGQDTLNNMSKDQREVLNWLTDLKLPQYYENFNSNGYDMVSIRGVTPEDLTDVGVTKAGHRKKLLSEIAKLGTADRIPNHKPDDVVTWLQLLGLQQYEENFMEGGFDDIDFIKDLDKNDLEMIEIRKKGHQKKLLMAVQRLTDLDLTADLDLVVEAQPVTSVPPSTSSDLSPMPPPPPPSMLEDLQTELNTNEPDFPMVPPPPPIDEFDLDPMSLRDNLPPPPGEESTSTYTHQPVKPEPPEQFRDRSMTAPNAPRTKPKPKPVAMKGQVRTASEYHAKESPPKAVVLPTPIAQPKQQVANGNSQDTVEVTAASSRGFWMQQMSQDSESNSAPQTPKRAMTVSGTRPPVTSPKPPPLIKPKPSKPSKEGVEIKSPGPNSKPSPPPTTPRKPTTGKKVPPPAPPRRDSKPTMDTQNVVLNNNNEEQPIERSRTLSGPLDEKIKEVFRGEPKKPSANIPKPMSVAPIIEQPLTEETPKQSLDDQIEETDLLMADIDNMIADFSSQLDSMF